MKRTVYQGVKFGTGEITIDGEQGKLLQFFDEKANEYIEFPMSAEEAKQIASLLTSGNVVLPTLEDKKAYGDEA
jgi:hypothetical protein